MKQYLNKVIFFSLIFALSACANTKQIGQPKDQLNQSQANSHQFKILGTKGSGEPPIFGYREYEPNSKQSIVNALEKLDGVEIDLQISSDSTLWMFENEKIKDCRSLIQIFPTVDDIELGLASQCWHHFQLIPLDSLIRQIPYLASADKIISFDLSFLNQSSTQNLFGGKKAAVKAVMSRLNKSLKNQPYQVLYEVSDESLIPLVEKQTDSPVFIKLGVNSSLSKQKKQNIVGNIEFIKGKGIKTNKLQISGVNYIEDMFYAINHKANYIQTENVELGIFFSKMSSEKLKDSLIFNESYFGTEKEEEQLLLADLNSSEWKDNVLLDLTIDSIPIATPLNLIFVTYDSVGNELSWEGVSIDPKLNQYWRFLNADKLNEKGGERLKVFISNQNKLNFKFKDIRLNKWYY